MCELIQITWFGTGRSDGRSRALPNREDRSIGRHGGKYPAVHLRCHKSTMARASRKARILLSGVSPIVENRPVELCSTPFVSHLQPGHPIAFQEEVCDIKSGA